MENIENIKMMKSIPEKEFPDPLVFNNGQAVKTTDDWQKRRQEIIDIIVDIEYGGVPPTPESTYGELLGTAPISRLNNASFHTFRIICNTTPQFSFIMQVLVPAGTGPYPVVLNGDSCFKYVTDEVTDAVLERGYAFATFNRLEIVPDLADAERSTGLYSVFPDAEFGALAAWAWGYHRCIDVLCSLDYIDKSKIAITGHSRGGKAVLLAGATDERIAVTNPNNSGSGGAGCYRIQGADSERLADTDAVVPYWFGPKLSSYVNREDELPFDQHFLKALIAPRALLTTEALDDLWSNPLGTQQTHIEAKAVYKFLGAEDKIAISFRKGKHFHGLDDWQTFLDFAAQQLMI